MPFKNEEGCFLFHLKSSFHFRDGLMRKISLILRFTTSQPGKQTIKILILPNISRSTDNQATKIENNIKNIFLEISCAG